jgi:hypothetical protein
MCGVEPSMGGITRCESCEAEDRVSCCTGKRCARSVDKRSCGECLWLDDKDSEASEGCRDCAAPALICWLAGITSVRCWRTNASRGSSAPGGRPYSSSYRSVSSGSSVPNLHRRWSITKVMHCALEHAARSTFRGSVLASRGTCERQTSRETAGDTS